MNQPIEQPKDVFSVDDRLALFAWELNNLAKSKEEADIMLRNRASYFASLYDDIMIYQNRYSDESGSNSGSASVEYNALDIIDKKAAYDARISRLRGKYTRFRVFLQQIDPESSRLFRKYFEQGDLAPDEKLNKALRKYRKDWNQYDTDRSKMLDEEAWDDFLSYRRQRAKNGVLDKARKEFFSFSNRSNPQERWENSTLQK